MFVMEGVFFMTGGGVFSFISGCYQMHEMMFALDEHMFKRRGDVDLAQGLLVEINDLQSVASHAISLWSVCL